MKKLALLLVVALAVGTVAFAGEYKCSKGVPGDTQDCLNMMAVKLQNKGWVGVHLERTDRGTFKIELVVDDSPAQVAGFKVGDEMVALNGLRFDEADEKSLEKEWQSMTPGKEVTYTISRSGTEKDVDVTLATLPDEVLAQWVGQHMLEHASVAQAQK